MRPLEGILVLDLSRVLAGPFCTMRLADLGARVIKVESADGDQTRHFGPPFVDGESPYFMSFNRGKESIVLDLKSKEGLGFVHRVLARADVLVENFRPGVMARLGLEDAELAALYPHLIRCGISGYGPLSPRHDHPAFDLAIQAESGLMAMNGLPEEEPCRVPISIADLAAGSAAVEGILGALIARARDGRGVRLDIALLDALVALFGYQVQSTLMTGKDPRRMGHRHPNLAPYQGFMTRDGMLVLAIAMDVQWQRFVDIDGMPEDLQREMWRTNKGRVEDRAQLEARLAEIFSSRRSADWEEVLRRADIPFGPVVTTGDMLRRMKEEESSFLMSLRHSALGDITMSTSPLVWNGNQRSSAALPPPVLGEHTESLMREFSPQGEGLS